jgi:hypothetical protein
MAGTTNKRKTAAEKAAEAEVKVAAVEAPEAPVETKEEVKPEVVAETPKVPEKETETVSVDELDGDVVAEFTQQLTIFGQFIYNAQEEGTTLIVENLGYGDIYVSDKPNLRVGDENQRLLFKEQKAFKARKLFMTSGSQPVASIIEIK